MGEIATGSFKLDACRGPKQVHFKAWSEELKKADYIKSRTIVIAKKIYQILRRSTTNSRYAFFFSLKSKLSGLS